MVTANGVLGGIPYETLSVVLAANEIRAISKSTAYLTILSATNAAGLAVSFNGAAFFNLPPGIQISDFETDELWLQDTSGAQNTVVLATGLATLRDNRLVIDTTNALPVTFSGTPSFNIGQIKGTATSVNAGAADAGTLRVAIATGITVPNNVTQFGGTNVSTGTGAGGAGIPRVTISNDSSLAANQSTNVNQYGGTNVVNGGTAGLPGVGGPAAHSAASSGNPVRVAGRVNTAVDTTLVAGDVSDLFITSGGALVDMPYSAPELNWTFASAAAGIVNSTVGVTAKAAAAAGVRNYITGLQLGAEALGSATEFVINDGAAGTVLWRWKIPTAGMAMTPFTFPSPLKGSAATLVEIKTLTASVTGGVYANLQGFTAP